MYDDECYLNVKIGETYKVSGRDCCIQAYFTSKLVAINPDYDHYIFGNGVVISGFGWVIGPPAEVL